MTDVNKLIAKAICQAQIASDSGKYKDETFRIKNGAGKSASKYGYTVKEDFIVKALTMIRTSKSMFNYFSVKDKDQNGYDSIITYFDFKIYGERYQVSFHTPLNKASKELCKTVGTGRETRWNKNKTSTSTDACQALIEYFNL